MRNKRFYLTNVLPVFLSVIAGIVIVILNNKSILHTRADMRITEEKRIMNSEMAQWRSEQKALRREEAGYDKILDDNKAMIDNIDTLQSQLTALEKDIENAQGRVSELDGAITEKQAYLDNLNAVKATKDGESRTVKDTSLKCPSDIKEGRYKAEGSGTVILKDIANRQKDRADLSTIDTHSYVFNISSGESAAFKGEVKLTEIVENN